VNHLLELALRTAKKSGDWFSLFFIVPHSREAERFGLVPGRYFLQPSLGNLPARATFQNVHAGDLLLR